jgi:hypothetical protein
VRRRNRFWHDADIRLPYSSQLRPRIDATNAGAITTPSLDYPAKRVAGKWPARSDRAGPGGSSVIQCSRIRSPARPFQLASVKLVPAAVPNCGTCGTAISALLGEAVIAKILYETLLLSCVAAFAIGVVIAAASACSARRGVPPGLRTGGARPGGAQLTILDSCLSSRGCPWGCRGLGWAHPRSAITLSPARRSRFHGSWSGETGRAALALLEALSGNDATFTMTPMRPSHL